MLMPFHVLPRWHEADFGKIGEQKTLTVEYSGLILVFILATHWLNHRYSQLAFM